MLLVLLREQQQASFLLAVALVLGVSQEQQGGERRGLVQVRLELVQVQMRLELWAMVLVAMVRSVQKQRILQGLELSLVPL